MSLDYVVGREICLSWPITVKKVQYTVTSGWERQLSLKTTSLTNTFSRSTDLN
jgi:hypothetical protein